MTEEQKEKRRESSEQGHIRWIKDNCLRTKDDNEDYVFISYKSDDYEKVLDDIVYNVCKKYGLRVYFDTSFDDSSDTWIKQYEANMNDFHCKAFIAFLDDAYYSSYACLLEMMTRRTMLAGGVYRTDSLFFLPVNIGPITHIQDHSNTGLGTRRFKNNKINTHAGEELRQFNAIFNEVSDSLKKMKYLYKRYNDTELYDEATSDEPKHGDVYLDVAQCRALMEYVIPQSNDNDGSNKSIVEAIHDKLVNANITTVFGEVNEEKKTAEKVVEVSTAPVDCRPSGIAPLFGGAPVKTGTRKMRKMSLKEMVADEKFVVKTGDSIYVKGHKDQTGTVTEDGAVQYMGEILSLNLFVQKVLGPGSRNAYNYVYHESTGRLLADLREEQTDK